MLPLLSSLDLLLVSLGGDLEVLVETATGRPGMGIIFVYSFLIAVVLPGPSEIVSAAPLELDVPEWAQLGSIMLVSATGKALGSVVAYHVGQEIKQAGPIVRWLRRSRWDIMAWSERRSI